MNPHMNPGWPLAVEGMERSYSHATLEWKATALEAVFQAAIDLPEFTADDVWARFPPGYDIDNGSALGHVMRQAKSYGWIAQTGRYAAALKPSMHCKHRPVWKSLLYGDKDL